ncbi:pyruvate flavodoxin/ferredoxin oxidoreductase domain protein [Vulcanisaeta moutnovskia 768-28]|uniref:2-oxoacid oxidoreductase (ferredoxin) n=1 Tax=Vulcanisaeta moutnovskia (strain 768-28) TaxID=985053 RepID=F0QYK6_VULM7|nr:2-oxoacid:ferredoxin oxidoreductase subunit alpha [Vulcanisaeta moutnovskia]ADY01439.1 pyruvate flavodoxin/ferredoxin oxidoreductase domain protein [Vulcanisaeta moutnovskia 768-28]
MSTDIMWVIGGPQGGGIDTGANVFMRSVARAGYYVIGDREYFSNIKGRHSYFMVRVSDEPKGGLLSTIDILVVLDAESVFTHFQDVKRGGYVIVDTSIFNTKLDQLQYMEDELKERLREFFSKSGIEPTVKGIIDYLRNNGINVLTMHYADLLQEVKKKLHDIDLPSLIGRYSNVVMTAYSTAIMGLPIDYVFKGLEDVFTGRRGKLLEYNKVIVEVVYEYVKSIKTNLSLPPIKRNTRAVIVNGNEAVAIGKILGGLRFQTYYPITPAADESVFIEAHNIVSLDPVTEEAKALEKAGIVVVQTEDEISAINMAIGAGIAGARTATATSGPGLSLMVEGTGFAGMNEVPVVITHYQRGGPSTGMPTRNSQSDLRFVMHMGHGEFPRIVISSGDHREAIEDAFKALNWAERYQMPVIHLVDKALANSYTTVIWDLDKKALKIDRGLIVTKDENDYRRFRITKDGVSPRSIPGLGPIFWLTGDEHDEFGHITEDPVTRTEMYEKRMKKLELADKEIPITDKVRLYGPESADITLVGWGSTKGVLLDVMNILSKEGYRVNFLQLKMFIPFPSEFVRNVLSKSQVIIDIESNYEAQAASIIREKTGIEIRYKAVKVTGRPIFVDEVYEAVKKILKDKDEKIILMKGP